VEDRTAVASEANRLYWDSEESVAEISNRLGLSRRALYDAIEPLGTGEQCASCGAELYYGNRSAKAAGVARCLMCGKEREVDPDISHEDIGTIPPYGAGWPAAPAATRDMRERAVTIAGLAIAGAIAGAIATVLIRRDR
jgi:hypothetical protein